MKLTTHKTLGAGRRVQGFLDADAAAVGIIVAAPLRAQLDEAVTKLADFQDSQHESGKTATGETLSQEAIRKTIYIRFLRPIGRITKFKLIAVAEYPTLIVSPYALRKGDFATVTRTLAKSAAKYQQLFEDNGMGPGFLDQLNMAIGQLDSSELSRTFNLNRRTRATNGLEALDQELRTVIDVIDGVISPALVTVPGLTGSWESAKRIAKTAVTPNPTAKPAVTPL